MTIAMPLQQLARSAAQTPPPSSVLPRLRALLFHDDTLSFWHDLIPPLKGLLNTGDVAHQLAGITPYLNTVGALLRKDAPPSLPSCLDILASLKTHEALFFLPHGHIDERLARLPLFAPLAVLHLAILGSLHAPPPNAPLSNLDQTVKAYTAYARASVDAAVSWRTDQLQISCIPLKTRFHGGPNLQVSCIDTLIGRAIVDETCPVYPGTTNALLQRAVERVSLYEERLHHKARLFWEREVLDVLACWQGETEKRAAPAAPNSIDGHLDTALYLILQGVGARMPLQ